MFAGPNSSLNNDHHKKAKRMKTRQHQFLNNKWEDSVSDLDPAKCQLVLAFGSSELLIAPETFDHLRKAYPKADILMSSTAGEISNGSVQDNSVVATAIELERSQLKCVNTSISRYADSYSAGVAIKKQLDGDHLKGIFIISDGLLVEGHELVRGFNEGNTQKIPITGGLAGDAARFQQTFTGLNEIPGQGNIIAVGFYGEHLHIGHGSLGGWDEFGYERVITKSAKNVLYKIDEESALDLYKKYLGTFVDELPGSALLFPLSMKVQNAEKYLIRTVLAVSDDDKSMTFAGNMPEGSTVRLMRGNIQKLIEASAIAAKDSMKGLDNHKPQLSLLLSCVGRKIILDAKSEEEVQAAGEVLGKDCAVTGFYTYGGLSPFGMGTPCELHNQTMTITTFSED